MKSRLFLLLLFPAIFAFLFFLFALVSLVFAPSGPGSDGYVTCNGVLMSPGDTCQHVTTTVNGLSSYSYSGSYTYDDQAKYEANLRAQDHERFQEDAIVTGITGGIGVILVLLLRLGLKVGFIEIPAHLR